MPVRLIISALLFLCFIVWNDTLSARQQLLDPEFHHLRTGSDREWASFPEQSDKNRLVLNFSGTENTGDATLKLRQADVKQRWTITLNNNLLGELHQDENDMTVYYSIPTGGLNNGENELVIEQLGDEADDILVGEIELEIRPLADVLSAGNITVNVRDSETGNPLPARITITNTSGSLQTTGASTGKRMAVRPGVIYTGGDSTNFVLPAGTYTLYANRGIEYGIDSTVVSIEPGTSAETALSLRREVNTGGYVSSDTHIHTLTWSGHGDATIEERMFTIAGEGVELPISTDHNVHVSYEETAGEMNVRRYFTPVTGNEVTTDAGHFNIFPVGDNARVPDHRLTEWDNLFHEIYDTPGVEVVILNHGRDIHRGFRPLGPRHFNAATGEFRDGRIPRFNAMEVINSGAQQTNIMQLFHDWFALLNRGYSITPVGSSDSHDVSRYIVGQARTYIRMPDTDPADIDVQLAAKRLVQGEVTVSFGLFTEILVNGRYGPGSLAPADGPVEVAVTVQGPGWVTAETVELYSNGKKIREAIISNGRKPGVKWSGTWQLEDIGHDVHLVAVAHGPGVTAPWWPVAKPYQPDSPEWTPYMIGATGAVWLDGDGDGKRSSAFDYASELVQLSDGTLQDLISLLDGYDEAVAAQAAGIYFGQTNEVAPQDQSVTEDLKHASTSVQRGFKAFIESSKEP